MGKVASPSVGYCSGFPEGSLSINGKIFSTENPPISYTIDGLTATVSDSMGVLGTADLTGNLVSVDEQVAIAGVEYCEGKPKAKLTWNKGSKTTENTPISFALTSNSGFTGGQCEGVAYYVKCTYQTEGDIPRIVPSTGLGVIVNGVILGSEILPDGRCGVNSSTDGFIQFIAVNLNLLLYFNIFEITRVDGLPDNCGDLLNDWILNVSDSTGQIAAYEYLEEPINFRVTCFDYDIKEASYACQGECPAGTEFQCICPETNTLTCYGFDPDNPDIFKPLFSSPITP